MFEQRNSAFDEQQTLVDCWLSVPARSIWGWRAREAKKRELTSGSILD